MIVRRIPVRIFQTGDRVYTPEGWATVVHDELEGMIEDLDGNTPDETLARMALYMNGVTLRLEEETSNNAVGDEVVRDRDILLPESEHRSAKTWDEKS